MARSLVFVQGRGVVDPTMLHAGVPLDDGESPRDALNAATEVLLELQAQGLKGDDLVNAVDRRERLLRGADPDVARALRGLALNLGAGS